MRPGHIGTDPTGVRLKQGNIVVFIDCAEFPGSGPIVEQKAGTRTTRTRTTKKARNDLLPIGTPTAVCPNQADSALNPALKIDPIPKIVKLPLSVNRIIEQKFSHRMSPSGAIAGISYTTFVSGSVNHPA